MVIEEKDLQRIRVISRGTYGVVYLGKYMENDVAIKVFKKRNRRINMENFLKEVEILRGLRHKNVVLYMGVCIGQSSYMIITEYMDRGSLYNILHEKNVRLPVERILDIIIEVAQAMVYLHKKQIVHCDLKSSNILVDHNWNIKLADFGLSRIRTRSSRLSTYEEKAKQKLRIGTPHWMAPEILRGEKYEESSDVYSFGLVVLELLTGQIPNKELSIPQITGLVGFNSDYRQEIPEDLPHEFFRFLIEKCTRRDPRERPSFQQILVETKRHRDHMAFPQLNTDTPNRQRNLSH
jgi:serine/threonine protein kinase